MKTVLIVVVSITVLLVACRKDSFITNRDAHVRITADTLRFDTVFTSTGSITQLFKIINENDQKIRINDVKLFGGTNSSFKINVDGFPGPEVNNLEVNANDSIYVFVSVTIDPDANNLPFVIRDSVQIDYNDNKQLIQLEAWGQNAHFFRNKKLTGNEAWINDLPYVILGSMFVDTNATLTINKGCRIYVHADAPLIIDGTLQVNGEKDTVDRVLFRSDRLDEPYRDFPASWPGIFFRGTSMNNVINYAIIKNAYQAIAVEDPALNASPKIVLNETIIDNAYDAGLIAVNSSVQATNCLVSNCGKNILLVKGGDYQFTHCTVVSYSNQLILHKEPVLIVSNFINVNNIPVISNLNASFRNCIFWGENGTVDNEVVVAKAGNSVFNVNFDHGIMKVVSNPTNGNFIEMINQSPVFDSINTSKNYYNFHLQADSPAIDQATNAGVLFDLDGNPRTVGIFPDLGCYEKQ